MQSQLLVGSFLLNALVMVRAASTPALHCCAGWLEPCRCPHFYIESSRIPCGEGMLLTQLGSEIPRFEVDANVELGESQYYTIIITITNQDPESEDPLTYTLLWARINIPQDALRSVSRDGYDQDMVISRHHDTNVVYDVLTQKTFVKDRASTKTLERLTALLVPQDAGYIYNPRRLDPEMINSLDKGEMDLYFPGNSLAAASYVLRPVDWHRELQANSETWIRIPAFTNLTLQGDIHEIPNPFIETNV